jgi:heme A synthase
LLTISTVIHQRFAIALLLLAVVLGAWGGYQFIRRRAISGGFRSSYLLMIALTAVQGLFGVLTLALGGHPREILHVVYGIFAIAFLPAIYLWSGTGGNRPREAAIMAASCWIAAIAYGRGIITGA